MVTTGIAARAGISQAATREVPSRQGFQRQQTIARYQTPRGATGLVVRLMDLLVRLDPR